MVFLETVQVLGGRYLGLYHGTSVSVVHYGFHHVRLFFPGIGLYCNQSAGLWGSGGRWPSLVSIITFLGGLILLSMGVMGLYVAKIYLETKKRQIYIVREQG